MKQIRIFLPSAVLIFIFAAPPRGHCTKTQGTNSQGTAAMAAAASGNHSFNRGPRDQHPRKGNCGSCRSHAGR
jgi:hypothetical protein